MKQSSTRFAIDPRGTSLLLKRLSSGQVIVAPSSSVKWRARYEQTVITAYRSGTIVVSGRGPQFDIASAVVEQFAQSESK